MLKNRSLQLIILLLSTGLLPSVPAESLPQNSTAKQAFQARQSDIQVQGFGTVIRRLPRDNTGRRHQRFILKLPSGQRLLIAHNIDIAPRIPQLSKGDRVDFYGEYEWNQKGGVIHWTHHDPQGRHPAGWLKHRGKIYQ